ncbi:MAG: hypothetical protein GEU90_14375 [Gemmatimonas sp.]|nr:hypothetical protein [Gemmatimonas sp.]
MTVSSLGAVSDTIIDGSLLKIVHLPAPELTAELLNTGVLLVYMRFSNGTWQLPYTSDAAGKPSTLDYFAKPGDIIITRFSHDDSGSVSISGGIQFRYVIIPGGVPVGANIADYEAMQQYFGIPD